MTDKDKALQILNEYMLSHEDDIAFGINDFGDLREAFKINLGRDAEGEDHLGRKVISGERVND